MARQVYEDLIRLKLTPQKALDLCAGCGIIGLDLLFHIENSNISIKKFDFIDIQNDYLVHFEKNCTTLKSQIQELGTSLNFLNLNYEAALNNTQFKEAYDLIVCNPPYFLPTQGKLSDNHFKNRCRFFIDSDLKNLVSFIDYALAKEGSAYLIFHNLKDHKIDLLSEIKNFIGSSLSMQILPSIRKSEFIKLSKK